MFPHHIECHPITLPRCLMLDFITNQQVCQIPSQPFSLLVVQTSGKLLNLTNNYHSSFIREKPTLPHSHLSHNSPAPTLPPYSFFVQKPLNGKLIYCLIYTYSSCLGGQRERGHQMISKLLNPLPPPTITRDSLHLTPSS